MTSCAPATPPANEGTAAGMTSCAPATPPANEGTAAGMTSFAPATPPANRGAPAGSKGQGTAARLAKAMSGVFAAKSRCGAKPLGDDDEGTSAHVCLLLYLQNMNIARSGFFARAVLQ
jgi:hypothetical protein